MAERVAALKVEVASVGGMRRIRLAPCLVEVQKCEADYWWPFVRWIAIGALAAPARDDDIGLRAELHDSPEFIKEVDALILREVLKEMGRVRLTYRVIAPRPRLRQIIDGNARKRDYVNRDEAGLRILPSTQIELERRDDINWLEFAFHATTFK